MALGNHAGERRLYPLYTLMTWHIGNGVVFPLHQVVRAAIGWHDGALLIARIHAPYVTFRVAQPERVIPIDTFGPEVLPPSWPGKEDNATTPDNPDSATPATSGAHESHDK